MSDAETNDTIQDYISSINQGLTKMSDEMDELHGQVGFDEAKLVALESVQETMEEILGLGGLDKEGVVKKCKELCDIIVGAELVVNPLMLDKESSEIDSSIVSMKLDDFLEKFPEQKRFVKSIKLHMSQKKSLIQYDQESITIGNILESLSDKDLYAIHNVGYGTLGSFLEVLDANSIPYKKEDYPGKPK